jgi:hypothetical protein
MVSLAVSRMLDISFLIIETRLSDPKVFKYSRVFNTDGGVAHR